MKQVTLDDMNEEQFRIFRARSVTEYAEDQVKAGTWTQEQSLEMSEQSYQKYLPDGLHTEGHYLYVIRWGAESLPVGNLWLRVSDTEEGKKAFIYDVVLEPDYRGQGLGHATMRALDETARSLGAVEIGLHVFGHNASALHVYEKAGYVITGHKATGHNMAKKIKG